MNQKSSEIVPISDKKVIKDDEEVIKPDEYVSLKALYQTAVDLRCQGKTYKEIAKIIRRNENVVARWFMTGGKLVNAYEERKMMFADERKEEWQSEFAEGLREMLTKYGMETLQKKGMKNPYIVIQVMDRVGFNPTTERKEDKEERPVNVNIIFNKNEQHVNATDQPNS